MAKKSITIALKDGKMGVDFDGFEGNKCFAEAAELERRLKEFGVVVELTAQQKKTPQPQVPETEAPTPAKNRMRG